MAQVLFSYHPDWMIEISRHIDHSRFNPSFAPFAHVDLAAFDLVVPLTRHFYHPVRGRADVRAIVPDAAAVAICDDKLAFARWAVEQGFGAHVPRLLEPGERTYPHILKVRHGEFGAGCWMISGPQDEPVEADGDQMFRQEAVPGAQEYVLHLLRAGEDFAYVQTYRYDMGVDLGVRGAGLAPRACTPVDPGPALAVARAMLGALDYQGTCCINYKIDDAGAVRIFEINPRFGGSLVGDITRYLESHVAALDRRAAGPR